MKPSITEQRAAVETMIHLGASRAHPATTAAAERAAATLRWIERNPDLVRAMAKLMVLFPGSEVEAST